MKTSDKIIQIVNNNGRVTAKELYDILPINQRAVFKQLKNLLQKGELVKNGTPPRVYYSISSVYGISQSIDGIDIAESVKKIIDENYLVITPSGEMKTGIEGFAYWTNKTHQDFLFAASDYVETLKRYARFKKNGLISGLAKFKESFDKVNVDEIHYLDFYSIERFGKTRLGQLLLYSKQSQNRQLIDDLVDGIKPRIMGLIRDRQIDGVAFVQPTVKRELQFMKELRDELNLRVRIIGIDKIKTPVTVPQKTLTKLEDRIENARNTFVVTDHSKYKNILIIDDAVGSGATINEIAGMMRTKKMTDGKIIGLAITGSFKGFDVISEV